MSARSMVAAAVSAARSTLLVSAAEFLDTQRGDRPFFSVVINACDGHRYEIPCASWPAAVAAPAELPFTPTPTPTAATPPGFRRLSLIETKIVGGLRGKGWVVTAELAASIGEEVTSDFRAVLRNMDGIVVETNQRLGVRLVPGQNAADREAG